MLLLSRNLADIHIARFIANTEVGPKFNIMNTDQLKKSAAEVKESAQDFINCPQAQGAINKGKDALKKGKDRLESCQDNECADKGKDMLDKGKDILDKGKDMLNKGKDKLEDFVEDKTNGKGILGFGSKD